MLNLFLLLYTLWAFPGCFVLVGILVKGYFDDEFDIYSTVLSAPLFSFCVSKCFLPDGRVPSHQYVTDLLIAGGHCDFVCYQ